MGHVRLDGAVARVLLEDGLGPAGRLVHRPRTLGQDGIQCQQAIRLDPRIAGGAGVLASLPQRFLGGPGPSGPPPGRADRGPGPSQPPLVPVLPEDLHGAETVGFGSLDVAGPLGPDVPLAFEHVGGESLVAQILGLVGGFP